ncbi:MAG TPA: hypothetical protein VM661_13630 [Candidatus Sulfotelmatobacter sp.]|nr:hypothetical protein [Candidatus Sulfotelmatobacter sp.]
MRADADASAFGQMQGALSWFIDAYTSLAEWKATIDRLVGFERAQETTSVTETAKIIRHVAGGADAVVIDGLDILLPHTALISIAHRPGLADFHRHHLTLSKKLNR